MTPKALLVAKGPFSFHFEPYKIISCFRCGFVYNKQKMRCFSSHMYTQDAERLGILSAAIFP